MSAGEEDTFWLGWGTYQSWSEDFWSLEKEKKKKKKRPFLLLLGIREEGC